MSSFGNVRSLERGLKVLEALNRFHGARAQQIARFVELPRPTVYRLLETMEHLGYVTRSEDAWTLTAQVKSLSAGFHDDVWVTRVASPILHELGREVLWPIDLVTFENDAMIIRETTHAESPFSIDRGMAGTHLPVLQTSGGRAYLAFCPDRDRELILARLRQSGQPSDAMAHDERLVQRILSETRQLGYGFRTEGFNPHTASISLPVLVEGRVLACITMIWIASALSFEEAVARNLDAIKRAVSRIKSLLDA
ncbi:helix-turn-helix domain-containing protein [Undibacter mobilis]|uniref:Transcriptional regulator n=1 Tax=Undibacter mobilis TaxID=2292256 RepID=A0A371BEF7_9BRAD|nr:helix-turn-helix domain-containing protein [Undibacter mobilis]RDV05793.1 transcriptional regulator [Undibacter mobilis]